MKKYRFILLCALVILGVNSAAFAITNIIYDQRPADLTKSGMHAHDYNITGTRERIILADDWIQSIELTLFNTVKDVHWFGYVENNVPHSLSSGFHLSIHDQDAQNPPCVPRDPSIWEKEVPIGSITVTDTGLTNFLGEKLYQYDYYLDVPDWVMLTDGQKYWFDVSANSVDPVNNVFKWKWAQVSTINYCAAAQKIDPTTPWQSMGDTDFAFVITSDDPPDPDPDPDKDYGDAPEGAAGATDAIAYPSLGVQGQFPTCKTVGPAGSYIEHTNFGAWFGNFVDFELDGNAGACGSASCFPLYDQDECFDPAGGNVSDPGLMMPVSFTIDATGTTVVSCPQCTGTSLGQTCNTAVWGTDVDIWINNTMPGHEPYLSAYVNVLMDWDQGGSWGGISTCPTAGAPEHVLVDFPIPPLYNGPLSALLPPSFTIGPNSGYVWTRFMISEAQVGTGWDGTGSFEDGESEDYLLKIDPSGTDELDFGDAPEQDATGAPTSYPTTLANNGARHVTDGVNFLGLLEDVEADGQPTLLADGDDINPLAADDEDGVTFVNGVLTAGVGEPVNVFVSPAGGGGGYLNLWIDYNADLDWDDTGEWVLVDYPVAGGTNNLMITAPASAAVGPTYARFRYTTYQLQPTGIGYSGQASDGEVEDYLVEIMEEPDEKLKFQQLPLNGLVIGDDTYYGHDELSTAYRDMETPNILAGCYMADDFADLADTPVLKIKWWGSYIENEIMESVSRFLIAFESDIPAQGHPSDVDYIASHPGEVILSQFVHLTSTTPLNPSEYSETLLNSGGPPCYEALFEYEAVLENPFPQDPNTVYWIKIVALIDDPMVWSRLYPAVLTSGLSLCDFLNLPYVQQAQYGLEIPVTRWGWHNRDYTRMDPYASTPPAVVPGEHNPRSYIPSLPAITGLPDDQVWHFQDDAVSGEVTIDEGAGEMPFVFQPTWIEEYYKYALPYCATTQGVDGPEEIAAYSKDLAFELWTPTECMKPTHPDYATWFGYGKPDCWCYKNQHAGDINGKSLYGYYPVSNEDLAIFVVAFMDPAGDICADLNHKALYGYYPVSNEDLTIFVPNFMNPIVSANPNVAHYNFYTTP